ncbi:MAG: LCP family protein [Oscillospiraceae bacterium]|nr:LCP family protein [Oscillospiraceae bacterium]
MQKKQHSKRFKVLRVLIIIALALVVLAVAAVAVHQALVKAPVVSDQPSVNQNAGKSDEDSAGDTDGESSAVTRKENFYTFLILGRDTGGGGNTDTILLAAYDVANQVLNVMSIPRDTMVNIPYDIKKINAVYNYAGGGDEGIEAVYTEVSELVGFVPDFSVVVEWEAVGELVDAIGGVWFDMPYNMYYDDPTQDLHIYVSKGYQLLDGDAAMDVIRWRQNNDGTGYSNGDIGRIATQQVFLQAVVEQCLQIQNVTKIQEFAEIFEENVTTDLTLGNLVWLAEQAIFGGLTMDNVNFTTMPGNYNGSAWSRSYQTYLSYVLPDAEELLAIINESFNPYTVDLTTEGLDIMSVNADGTLSSTTGVVEDSAAASG